MHAHSSGIWKQIVKGLSKINVYTKLYSTVCGSVQARALKVFDNDVHFKHTIYIIYSSSY